MAWNWVYTAVAVLTVLHGVAVLSAYRNGRDAEAAGHEDRVTDGVMCPDCGAHNETHYRLCRQCVSELPVETSVLDGESMPRSRRTL